MRDKPVLQLTHMAAPDQMLGGYRLIARIGAGGMGEVWKAEDMRLGRPVAIKILPDAVASDSEATARMRREARTAAQLNHPNIATIHAFDEAEGQTFIVMEFVAGEPLSALIRKKTLSEADVCRIGRGVAEALAEAHEKGVIHRDIKPDNIIVSGQRVKVLDFGIAKRVGLQHAAHDDPTAFVTQQGMILGTVHYMSPEQALGKTLDARTDIFSLGVVLYEAATGKLPFAGETITETITQIVRDEAEAPIRLNPAISAGLNAIIERCLKKKREDRFASAADLAAALDAQLASVPTELRTNPNIAAIGPDTSNQPTLLPGSLLKTVEETTKTLPPRKPVPSARAATAVQPPPKKSAAASIVIVIAISIAVITTVLSVVSSRRGTAKRSEIVATATAAPQQQAVAAPAAEPSTSTVAVTAAPVIEEKTATVAPNPQSPPATDSGAVSAPPSADQSYEAGMSLLATGDSIAAREKFVEAVRQDPQHAKAHFRLGEIALLNHNIPHATGEFEKALQNKESLSPRERALTELGLAIAVEDRGRVNFLARQLHRANPSDPDLMRMKQAFGYLFGPGGEGESPQKPRRRPFRP